MFYKIFKILCRMWFGLIFRTRVIGAENIPASGGNVTLHPDDAPQRYDDLKSIAATERNAAHC